MQARAFSCLPPLFFWCQTMADMHGFLFPFSLNLVNWPLWLVQSGQRRERESGLWLNIAVFRSAVVCSGPVLLFL